MLKENLKMYLTNMKLCHILKKGDGNMNIVKAIQATAWIVNIEKGYYKHNILTVLKVFIRTIKDENDWY